MEDNREIAIKIQGLKKRYKLGQIGGGTLQGDLQSWWAKIRGKEDPNSKIGSDQRSNGKTFMALNGIDLTIYKGEAIGIIGSNGAGKSTMLKILSRITAPTEGKIDLYGRIASMLEVGTGFNGQLTGRENVYMNGAILGMSKSEVDAKMEQIIEFSEVREFIDTPVKRYSSGMYVKLAFAVAAHLDSEIMIMDEVLAVGDMAFQKKCLDKMRDAANTEGRTVLYVSHNMNTIRQLCKRCIVLDKGKLIYDGDVETAIGIYLGASDTTKGIFDVSNIERQPEFKNGAVTINTIELKNCPQGNIDVGEKLMMNLTLSSKKDLENVYMRVLLKSSDSIPVSMCPSKNHFDINADSTITVSSTLDLSGIAPGKYALGFVIYHVNECGNNFFLDGLNSVIRFDINQKLGFNQNMEWLNSYWGHTVLPPFDIYIIS